MVAARIYCRQIVVCSYVGIVVFILYVYTIEYPTKRIKFLKYMNKKKKDVIIQTTVVPSIQNFSKNDLFFLLTMYTHTILADTTFEHTIFIYTYT